MAQLFSKKLWQIKLLLATLLTAFIYFLSSPKGDTPYNYFILLSDAFLHLKYWITQNPPWLSELIPGGLNRFYIAYPPMPAILALPFVFLFGITFPQQYLAHIIGALFVLFTVLIARKINPSRAFIIWAFLFSSFGTIMWFMSSIGSAWYLGQTTAALFLTIAIFESLTKKRVWLVSLLLGFAYLSRIHTILSLPFFLYCLKDDFQKEKKQLVFGASILFLFLLINSFYNFIRFGVPWDAGYYLIPGVLQEPWFAKGIMHPSYIPNNLQVLFLQLPRLVSHPPFVEPTWTGLAIWFTTPAFIFSLWAPIKENLVKYSWLAILLIGGFVTMHGTTGFAQFGYRFAVDFYPFLIFLTLKGINKQNLSWRHWTLLNLSILVNLWGVLWINKFGWADF